MFSCYSMKNGTLVFVDKTDGYLRYEFSPKDFSYTFFCDKFNVVDPRTVYLPAAKEFKDWNDQLLNKRMNIEDTEKRRVSERPEGEEISEGTLAEEERRGYRFGR